VNQAVTQMDDVTQQNAALVEQAAAAAASLQDQAVKLSAAVSVFTLDERPAAPSGPTEAEAFRHPASAQQERRARHSPLRGKSAVPGADTTPQRRRS
jgi:hypothetical protein